MSPYREPESPVHTDRVITLLPPAPARFSAKGVSWGVVGAAYIWLALDFMVEPLTADQGPWRLVLCLAAWVILPFFLLREVRRGAVQIGATSLRRIGLFRTHVVPWSDISHVEHVTDVSVWGGGPTIRLQTSEGALVIPEFGIMDPGGVLDWAIDEAVEGRTREIAARVQQEGVPEVREGRSWVPMGAMLLVFAMLGAERLMAAQ